MSKHTIHTTPAAARKEDAEQSQRLLNEYEEATRDVPVPEEMPARFTTGGATAEERDAWIAAHGG